MTPEDPQKTFYKVMRHFILVAQKIPGEREFSPLADVSSANILLFFLAWSKKSVTFVSGW